MEEKAKARKSRAQSRLEINELIIIYLNKKLTTLNALR